MPATLDRKDAAQPSEEPVVEVRDVGDLPDDPDVLKQTLMQRRESMDRLEAMETALARAAVEPGDLNARLFELKEEVRALQKKMTGRSVKREIGERTDPAPTSRLWPAYRGISSTYGPTEMHQASLDLAKKEISSIEGEVLSLKKDKIPAMEKALREAGAPWIEGMPLPQNE